MKEHHYGSRVWEELFAKGGWGRYPSEEAIRFYMRARKSVCLERPRALDLGCGTGACSWFMAKEGAAVTAMDGAPSGLALVLPLARSFGVRRGITTVLGDIVRPKDFLAGSFDIILDHYSLYANSADRIERAFRELHDLLADGGRFLTCCFDGRSVNCGAGDRVEKKTLEKVAGEFENGKNTFFSRRSLRSLFKRLGYAIEYEEEITVKGSDRVAKKLVTCLKKTGNRG